MCASEALDQMNQDESDWVDEIYGHDLQLNMYIKETIMKMEDYHPSLWVHYDLKDETPIRNPIRGGANHFAVLVDCTSGKTRFFGGR